MTQRVLGAFEQTKVKRGGASLLYIAGLIGSLVVLVLMTLIYLAMIAGGCWLLYWHLSENTSWYEDSSMNTRARGRIWVGYWLVAGFIGIVVLFLVKPLFAPAAKQSLPVTLDPVQEPALFALIHRICDAVGAPRPAEVQVDCRVNAAAGLRRGLASFFTGDLSLTIGMPMVAGLTTRQLAGVLAHEFGHFAQGAGMRFSYLVRRYNHWFERLVYERDSWDLWLEGLTKDEDKSCAVVWTVVERFIWAERLVLKGLMRVGGAASGFMSRQMEYDADRYEALIAGTSEFAVTTRRFRTLSEAHEMIINDAIKLVNKGELPDNVPVMVAMREREMPKALRCKIEKAAEDEETRWWSTHPTDKDRIRAVEKTSTPGIFHLEDPATALFRDFADLSRNVSIYWYEVDLGLNLNHVRLLGAEQAEEVQASDSGRERAVGAFFGGTLFADRLLPVPMTGPEQWPGAAEHCKKSLHEYTKSSQAESEARVNLTRHGTGCALLDLGFRTEHLPDLLEGAANETVARQMHAKMQIEHGRLSTRMRVFEEAAWTRIAAALAWKFNDAGTDESWRRLVVRLVPAQRILAEVCAMLRGGWVDANATSALVRFSQGMEDPSYILDCAWKHDRKLYALMELARTKLGVVTDPCSPTGETLSRTLWAHDPEAQSAIATFGIFERSVCVHAIRISGDLCLMAHEIEQAWNVPVPQTQLTMAPALYEPAMA